MSAPLSPDDEIEITDEMIVAGAEVLRQPFAAIDLAEGWLTAEEVVVAIYRAMQRLRPANGAGS